MKKISFKISMVIGIILCIFSLIVSLLTNFNTGNLLSLSFGMVFIFIGHFWDKFEKNKIMTLLKIGTCLYMGFFIFMSGFIFINSKANETNFTDDALIVLGCALHGEKPSPTLYRRLEKAVIYAENNKKALIVVSGGQGPQESITEAEAMKRYLVKNGIDENRIILEDKSTSTYENFKFSKAILDKSFDRNYTVCYITSDFHSYRANSLAKINGLETLSFNCSTDIYSFIPLYLRECLAIIKLWIFKQ